MATIRDGYLAVDSGCRKAGRLPKRFRPGNRNARIIWKNWFFGTQCICISTLSVPKYYRGKRLRFKVEVIDDDN